jgi:hypothetical protein
MIYQQLGISVLVHVQLPMKGQLTSRTSLDGLQLRDQPVGKITLVWEKNIPFREVFLESIRNSRWRLPWKI